MNAKPKKDRVTNTGTDKPTQNVVLERGRQVTLDTPGATVRSRLDHFRNSGLLWLDNTVEVHRKGKIWWHVQPFDLQDSRELIFVPLAIKTGSSRFSIPDKGEIALGPNGNRYAMRLHPETFASEFDGPTKVRSFSPFATRETLADWFGGRLPDAVRPFVADRIDESIVVPLHSRHLMQKLAVQAQNYDEPMRSIANESLAMQIMTLFLHDICGADAKETSLSAREIRGARGARDRLLLNLRTPPSTSELAELAGMSERRLDRAFVELFGASIFKTLTNARLDYAQEMLLRGNVPIKELAYRLGYTHASSFSHAFYRRFGFYPSRAHD